MRIRFTMVPLPMTAAEKFNEAVYFYNQMIATVNNTRTFPFNLSACLSALRSTTFYLQVQYGHDERFAEWYGRAQETMKKDPLLKLLNELRRGSNSSEARQPCCEFGACFPRRPDLTVTEVFEVRAALIVKETSSGVTKTGTTELRRLRTP